MSGVALKVVKAKLLVNSPTNPARSEAGPPESRNESTIRPESRSGLARLVEATNEFLYSNV